MKNFTGAVLSKLNNPLEINSSVKIPKLKSGQVLVKVSCSGVCHSQLMEKNGHRGNDKYLPHFLGHEGSGTVIAIGEGVKKVSPGDYVVLSWIKSSGMDSGSVLYDSNSQKINAGAVTTFNEMTVVSENRCVKIPSTIPSDIAALMGCAVPTGCGIIKNSLNPTPNKLIALFGMGGIGLSALTICHKFKFKKIFCVDINQSKLDMAKEINSEIIAINSSISDPYMEIINNTDGNGVDYAVDASGKPSVTELAFEVINRQSGHLVFASHPKAGSKISIDPFDLISGKKISGSWGGESNPDLDIPFYCDLYLKGELKLDSLITKKYELSDINNAFEDLENGTVIRPIINMVDTS